MVIVSERTARRFWPGQDPIGKQLTLTMLTDRPAQVIGVVREVKLGTLDAGEADSETAVYAPAAQFAHGGSTMFMRTTRDPESFTRSPTRRRAGQSPCAGSLADRQRQRRVPECGTGLKVE